MVAYKANFVPTNTYQVKKVTNPLTMGVERIHACPNHCILYRGKFKDLEKCPTCGASRYKRNDTFCDDDQVSTIGKSKRKKKGAPDPSEEDTCLCIDEKKRRIPALVF